MSWLSIAILAGAALFLFWPWINSGAGWAISQATAGTTAAGRTTNPTDVQIMDAADVFFLAAIARKRPDVIGKVATLLTEFATEGGA